jgi:hypothetical protein
MPTPSDTYDIEQARSHLDAIYNHVDEPVEQAPRVAMQQSAVNRSMYGASDVPHLTAEAKSHSNEFVGPKVELVATYGSHLQRLRAKVMYERNAGNR